MIKKKVVKKPPGLYDIDNFVVQNGVKRITQKKEILNIPIPVFLELNDASSFSQISESVNLILI
jgi:hypothetical protein